MSYSYPDKQILRDSLSNLADLIRLGRSVKGVLKWVTGDIITAPATGSVLASDSCRGGSCSELYVYGFMISSSEANTYMLTFTKPDGSSTSIRIVAPTGGILYLTDYVALNEGEPADSVALTVVNSGTGTYQARLLVLEVQ